MTLMGLSNIKQTAAIAVDSASFDTGQSVPAPDSRQWLC